MKLIHIVGSIVITALLSGGTTYLLLENKYEKELSKMKDELNESLEMVESVKEEEPFVSTVDVFSGWEHTLQGEILDGWKSGDKPFAEKGVEYFEYAVQEMMQNMAHQKIIADVKEASLMITPERIDTLILMVEENKDDLEHEETYLEILNRWKKSDFSLADFEHNKIMLIQGTKSTEGIASGLSSREQEKNYILQVFSKDVDEIFGWTE